MVTWVSMGTLSMCSSRLQAAKGAGMRGREPVQTAECMLLHAWAPSHRLRLEEVAL